VEDAMELSQEGIRDDDDDDGKEFQNGGSAIM
jgi:hypothetical protein